MKRSAFNITVCLAALAAMSVVLSMTSCSKKDKQGAAGTADSTGQVAQTSSVSGAGSASSADGSHPAQALPAGQAVSKTAGASGGSVGAAAPGTSTAPGNAAIPSTSGSAKTALPTAQASAAPVIAAAPIISCFTLSYAHKKMSSHSSEEICGQHKNKLKLRHDNINKGAMCVRVDGRPVGFQFVKKDEIVIGPVAGPDSKITVRYCLGKVKCNEDCKVPKDDFMDAIGAGDDSDRGGGWADAGDEKDKKNAARLATIEADLKKELADTEESDLFAGWLNPEGAENYTCGTRQAGKTADGGST